MRNRNQKGFTLIELLIVIAIIGILSAVLIPNLLAARTRALDTAALSCARSIATAQEIEKIDSPTNTYSAWEEFENDPIVSNCSGMEGNMNNWDPENYANSADGWKVQHPNGNAAYRVKEGAIETVPRIAVANAIKRPGP
jgi:type IV pilus assembly protein PilA